jgi:hypothetical protein
VIQFLLQLGFVAYVYSRGSRSGIVFIGSMLILMGAVGAAAGVSVEYGTFQRSFVLLVSVAWLAAGVFIMRSPDIRAFLAHRAGHPLSVVAKDDERWGDSRGIQIVGRSCGVCSKRFLSERDAVVCTKCSIAFHEGGCITSHRDKAHREAQLSET